MSGDERRPGFRLVWVPTDALAEAEKEIDRLRSVLAGEHCTDDMESPMCADCYAASLPLIEAVKTRDEALTRADRAEARLAKILSRDGQT